MRCAFLARSPRGEDVRESLWALAERDRFYVNQDAFDKDLAFVPLEEGGCRVEVYGEMGENLLAWAGQQGFLRFKKA